MADRKTWEAQPACEPRVADVIVCAGIHLRDATPEIASVARHWLDYYGNVEFAADKLRRTMGKVE